MRAVWLLGLVAAVALVAVIGYTAATNPALLGLAAPDSTRRPVAMASPTASPLPTNPSATPSATASPPSPVQPDPAARFLAFASDPTWSFRLEADATVRVNGELLSVFTVLEQSGPDFAIDMRIRMRGRSGSLNVIVKDDVAYYRQHRSKWRVSDPAAVDLPVGSLAFSQLRANEAVMVRTVTRRGNELHLLRVPSTVAAGVDPSELEQLGCDTDDLGLDLWVRSDGTPVSATFEYSCVRRFATGEQQLTASATYEFSRVGRPLVIKPPAGFR